MTTNDDTATITKLVSACPALLGLFTVDGKCLFLHGSSRLTSHLTDVSQKERDLNHIFPAISEASDFWEKKLFQVKEKLHTVHVEISLTTRRLSLLLFPIPHEDSKQTTLVGSIALEVPDGKPDTVTTTGSITERMLGIVGHELRNPLAALGAGIKLIELRVPNAPYSDILGRMKRQIEVALRLVNDLVDTTHATNRDGLPIILHDELLSEVINFSLDAFQHRVAEKRHSLTVTIPDIPVGLRCDLGRLSQAITNLVHNACKYTPEGGQIALSVDVSEQEIAIHVSDNGVGIPSDKLTSIFEPFTQIDASSSYADRGVGLGLFLVKAIVEGHGGTINASSPGNNGGSVFTIRIPRSHP